MKKKKFALKLLYDFSLLVIMLFICAVVGVVILDKISSIPFKLCNNETGLIQNPNPDENWIFYNCSAVKNITFEAA